MAASKTAAVPVFRGRNISLSEIAQTSGIGMATIKHGLRDGVLDFCYAVPFSDSDQYRYYCHDKLVYEKLGYFNRRIRRSSARARSTVLPYGAVKRILSRIWT